MMVGWKVSHGSPQMLLTANLQANQTDLLANGAHFETRPDG
jgi:hypothetical protein